MKIHFHWKIQPKFISFSLFFFFALQFSMARCVACIVCRTRNWFSFCLRSFRLLRPSCHVNFLVCWSLLLLLLLLFMARDSYVYGYAFDGCTCHGTHGDCGVELNFAKYTDKSKLLSLRILLNFSMSVEFKIDVNAPQYTASYVPHTYQVEAIWTDAGGEKAVNTQTYTHTHSMLAHRYNTNHARWHCIPNYNTGIQTLCRLFAAGVCRYARRVEMRQRCHCLGRQHRPKEP